MTILVTGGAGFIGSNFVIDWFKNCNETVVILDKLTYAGNLENLSALKNDKRLVFIRGDIGDPELTSDILKNHKPRAVINFAAESHVDRSIYGPEEFMQTNVVGTFRLLQSSYDFWSNQEDEFKQLFRFLHVSTDEVYGSLNADSPPFRETNRYEPNSPYSASKASSDHLVRAYYHTYGLPVLTTNCSNNYGPFQFPEKLIPLMINNAIHGKSLPIYGDGKNVRDWLYVGDHCTAIRQVLEYGKPGEVYNIGGLNEKKNTEIVNVLCDLLDEMRPKSDGSSYSVQIVYVKDRPGHDRRYAIDATKIQTELGWKPDETFESGIRKTIIWYLNNFQWLDNVTSGEYRHWVEMHY